MKIKIEFVAIVLIATMLAGMALYSGIALILYPGKLVLFSSFCIIFITAWGMAWFGFRSYLYILFSTFCLLGFWMKACTHLILGHDFVEPTGFFDGSGTAWDKAITVSMVAGLGILLFRVIQMFLMRKHKGLCILLPSPAFPPHWYARFRKWIWTISLLLIVFVSIVNFELGINQAGLLPKNHLPFKLNAIIIWCLYSALAFWMATLVWWDICLGLGFKFEALVFEGILSSVTVLSRSLYITHVAHYFLSIAFNRDGIKLNFKKYVLIVTLFMAGLFVVLISVAELRRDRFYGESNTTESGSSTHSRGRASLQFFLLLSERWIGLEGVMSTSSYPFVGGDLFKQGWLDMPSYKQKPVYERVANSIYISPNYPNADKYNFLSTPGLVAMLHFSGSLTIVGFGVFIILAFFSLCEYLIYITLKNPFVLSLYGMIIAMMLHQFGGLYVNLIQIFEIGFFMVLLWGIKYASDFFEMRKSAD